MRRALLAFLAFASSLQLAAQEYSLPLPLHFKAERPRHERVDGPGRHFDLGL